MRDHAKRRGNLRKTTMKAREYYANQRKEKEKREEFQISTEELMNIIKSKTEELERQALMSVMIDSININFEESPDPIEEFVNAATMEDDSWTEEDTFKYCTENEVNHTIDKIDDNVWDEMVNKISTEFPKPVNFECPKSVSMNKQMALAIDVITKLVDGEEIIIDGGKFKKPDTQSDAHRHVHL